MKIFIPVFLLIVSVGLFLGYTDPTYKDIKSLVAEEQKFDDALNKSKELQEARDTLLSRYNEFSPSDLEKLRKLLPDNVDNVRLILDIDGIASRYGMRTKNVATTRSAASAEGVIGTTGKSYDTVTLSFSVTATYQNIISFLKDIEKSLRIVDVTELSLKDSKGSLYEYNISVETYWLR